MNNNTTYLLSSFKDNPETLFQGYCFEKENFIFGQAGANKYYEETGKEISFGEDGCYVLARKVEKGYIIGSDSAGYKKILYFKDESSGHWAVSNSLSLLIEHLVESSVIITPNIPLLMMMSVGASVSQQPITFNTIANEIKILPINTSLRIGFDILEINNVNKLYNKDICYDEVMLSFINMWASRFSTLISCKDMLIQQGLTGGLDSRSIFSLSNFSYNNKKQERNADYRLISGLTRGDDTDLKVAQQITNHYGYDLNDKSPFPYTEKFLSSEEKYLGWKNICLGLYHPIYFPKTEIDYRFISIGGGGGENYREFYGKNPKINSYSDFVKNLCSKVKSPELQLELAIDLYDTLLQIRKVDIYSDEIDPLILHYKHFRTRFHSGLFPQYRISFTPLSSRYLANIVTKENYKKIKSSQILYDLISLTDDLLTIPFDSSQKFPKKENLDQLIKVHTDLKIKTGSVFTGEVDQNGSEISQSMKLTLKYLKDDFDLACNTKLVKELWSKKFIAEASSKLDEVLKKGKFSHATDGISISTIIATGMFKDHSL